MATHDPKQVRLRALQRAKCDVSECSLSVVRWLGEIKNCEQILANYRKGLQEAEADLLVAKKVLALIEASPVEEPPEPRILERRP